MDGGTLAYGPVSTLAECLQHIAGCTECKGHWPAVPGMLAMTRRPDGHVDFEVSAAAAGPPGLRLLTRHQGYAHRTASTSSGY